MTIGRNAVAYMDQVFLGQHDLYTTLMSTLSTVDWTKTDYRFWDRFAHAQHVGDPLDSIFAQPLLDIRNHWTLGKGFLAKVEGRDDINQGISHFIEDNLKTVQDWIKTGNRLGDSWLIVNSDGSLSVPSPDIVTPEFDPLDYRRLTAVIVRSKIETVQTVWDEAGSVTPEMTKTITAEIVDRYTPAQREIRMRLFDGDKLLNDTIPPQVFPNPLGVIPVVHYAPGRTANEVFGRPIYETLLRFFRDYADVLRKGIGGVKVMAGAIPTYEELVDPQTEMDENQEEDPQTGEKVERFDVNSVIYTSGKFSFKSPPAFTEDIERILGLLFLLMLQHTRIPEGVWGGALASSKASFESQLPVFERTVQGWQSDVVDVLKSLVKLWLAWQGITDPRFRVSADERLQLSFPPTMPRNEQLSLEKVKYAEEAGLIQRETAARELDFPTVEDPAAEVAAAQQEREATMQRFQELRGDQGMLDALASREEPGVGDRAATETEQAA